MEGKVEEEKGAMAEDEEEMAEAGEVEKRRMHQCSECGKRYKHEHKLKHHKTWLCKERALGQVQSEPRRELSSNFFHLPTIPEGEEVFASERVSKPCDQGEDGGNIASERDSKPSDQGECAKSFASERVSKPQVQGEGAGTIASKRVSKPLDQGDGAVAFLCFKCKEPFTSNNSLRKHIKRKHKGEQVIRFSDI